MNDTRTKLLESINLLPDSDIDLLYIMVDRLLVSLDSDYTFVTRKEREHMNAGLAELESGDFINLNQFIKEHDLTIGSVQL